jgi:hypothetical protein
MSEEKELRQWGVKDGTYSPIGATATKIKAGVYQFVNNGIGIVANPVNLVTDDLIELPDPTCAQVLAGIEKFWTIEDRYRRHGLLYKRSVGLYGPPGGGKTATVILLARKLIAQDGLVILYGNWANEGLTMLRKVEPKRRIVCIMEELDDILDGWESEVLSLLDGEQQVDGIVYVATTNHFDQLPSTIVNRPSRFDEWISVGMPLPAIRAAYLAKAAPQLSPEQTKQWVADTEGFSIAHLKEMVVAVLCLDVPYAEVLARLRKMLGVKSDK